MAFAADPAAVHENALFPNQGRLVRRAPRTGGLLVIVAVFVLTLAPPAYLCWVVVSTGAENPSNDIVETAPIVDQVLAGSYAWRHLVRDTFLEGAHFMILPVLLRLGIAQGFRWDIYYESYAVILLAAVKLLLLHAALARGTSRPYRLFLWPVLSALVFSLSQIDIFTFGDSGLSIQMTQVGLCLGLWGLVCFPDRAAGVALACVGGLIACYSGGGGPLVWPVFLGCMWLTGCRRRGQYLAWFAGATAGCLPYVVLRYLYPHPAREVGGLWFSVPTYLQALGWPFTYGWIIDQARLAGIIGAGLGGVALLLCWRYRRSLSGASLAASLALMAYGLISIFVVVKFRGRQLAPWYVSAFMTYWLGLAGLAYRLWIPRSPGNPAASLAPSFGGACLAALAVLFVQSNLTYGDKAFYLYSRAPAAASALRHYQTAPTYAEQYVFQWDPDHQCQRATPAGPALQNLPALAEILERHGLSVFAARQRWTLQGEFPLDNVRLTESADVPEVAWWADMQGETRPFSHYEHLNLFLHPPNAVHWQVAFPKALRSARFRSAVVLSPTVPADGKADGAECQLHLEDQQGKRRLLWAHRVSPGNAAWAPCDISLQEYAGQTVTLHLSADPLGSLFCDWVLWKYPCIDVVLDEPEPPANLPIRPSNTDLSASQPKPSAHDMDLDIQNAKLWDPQEMTRVPGEPGVWKVGAAPRLRSRAPLRLTVRDYSHLYIQLAVPQRPGPPRYLQLGLTFDTQPGPVEVVIPLLSDSGLHTYTYDLKLLRGFQAAHLVGVRLDLHDRGAAPSGQIRLSGMGLIRNPAS